MTKFEVIEEADSAEDSTDGPADGDDDASPNDDEGAS
jgi:hypothetical protein